MLLHIGLTKASRQIKDTTFQSVPLEYQHYMIRKRPPRFQLFPQEGRGQFMCSALQVFLICSLENCLCHSVLCVLIGLPQLNHLSKIDMMVCLVRCQRSPPPCLAQSKQIKTPSYQLQGRTLFMHPTAHQFQVSPRKWYLTLKSQSFVGSSTVQPPVGEEQFGFVEATDPLPAEHQLRK